VGGAAAGPSLMAHTGGGCLVLGPPSADSRPATGRGAPDHRGDFRLSPGCALWRICQEGGGYVIVVWCPLAASPHPKNALPPLRKEGRPPVMPVAGQPF
jgi:hypothetical protein